MGRARTDQEKASLGSSGGALRSSTGGALAAASLLRPSFVRASLVVALGLFGTSVGHAEAVDGTDSAPVSTVSEPAPASPPVLVLDRRASALTLAECLRRAEVNYPKVHEALARLRTKESQRSEAHRAPFGEFTVTAGLGVIPGFRGTSLYSPSADTDLTSHLSLAYQFGIEGLVPLWTFGKISSLWSAAAENVKVGKAEVEREKNLVRFEVRRAYYGVLLARDALVLVREAKGMLAKFDEAAGGAGGEEDVERLKLQMNAAELDARESEAEKNERVALAALSFFVGAKSRIEVPDRPLRRLEHELGPPARYLEAARLHRPEVNMVRAGIAAREALLGLEQARYLPDLGLGVTAKLTRAPDVTDQRNPFGYDPYNIAYAAAGLVLRWKLDFLPQSARVERAKAELEEMRATERFALGGIGVEVEKAYAEAVDAKKRLDAWSRATQFAKRWLIQIQQSQELGVAEDDEIVEPAKEYALKRFSEMSATFDYNVALAQLAVATGWDELAVAEREQ